MNTNFRSLLIFIYRRVLLRNNCPNFFSRSQILKMVTLLRSYSIMSLPLHRYFDIERTNDPTSPLFQSEQPYHVKVRSKSRRMIKSGVSEVQLSYVDGENIVEVTTFCHYTAISILKEPMTPPARYFNPINRIMSK